VKTALKTNENDNPSRRRKTHMLKTRRGLFVRGWAHAVLAFAVLTTAVLAHAVSAFVALPLSATTQTASPDSAAGPALLVNGAVKQELRLTLNDLKSMPRTKVTAKGHDGSTHEYEGVTLAGLLTKAGAPQAGDLRGKSMSLCVVAEGSDGYRAAFSLAELDVDFANESVLVADTADGKDLGPDQGPLRLVVPGDNRQGRWVRQLKSLSIVNAGS
jgi:DMSO/TMAO reductase YedYZ molybdopterin-dependent catalytic subunit